MKIIHWHTFELYYILAQDLAYFFFYTFAFFYKTIGVASSFSLNLPSTLTQTLAINETLCINLSFTEFQTWSWVKT